LLARSPGAGRIAPPCPLTTPYDRDPYNQLKAVSRKASASLPVVIDEIQRQPGLTFSSKRIVDEDTVHAEGRFDRRCLPHPLILCLHFSGYDARIARLYILQNIVAN
jgi:hypothetical protein